MVRAQSVQKSCILNRKSCIRKPIAIQMWLFAHEGLTDEAVDLAKQEGIFWSTREQLDDLLTYLGLRILPQLDE